MIELVVILLIMFAIGVFVYATKYHSKEKRKVGISRKNYSDYFKDYSNLKLY